MTPVSNRFGFPAMGMGGSFPPRRSEISGADGTAEQGCVEDNFTYSPCDSSPSFCPPASMALPTDSACGNASEVCLPHGRSLSDTQAAGREALTEYIESALGKSLPTEELSALLEAAARWSPSDSAPFQTFDPKEQAYETQLKGQTFTVTFTEGWRTARALRTSA